MDPFRLCLAVGPVAVYMLLLGLVNLSRRPLLVSGARDVATMGLAVAGLVILGPLELFFPPGAVLRLGGLPASVAVLGSYVAFYGLLLILVLLMLRPRLVIYNISADQLRPILAETVDRLDAGARWAGDSLSLPGLGVQLHVDNQSSGRSVSLVSAGGLQDYAGWRRLERALATPLEQLEGTRNPRGISLVAGGLFIIGALATTIVRDPQAMTEAIREMLQM